MSIAPMYRFAWRTHTVFRRHYVASITLLANIAITFVVWAIVVPMLKRDLAFQQARAATPAVPQATSTTAPSSHRTVNNFLSTVQITTKELPQHVERVHVIARTQGLMLHAGEYALTEPMGDLYRRYQLTIPIRARFTDVRRFAESVLRELPFASLDEISVKKTVTADSLVETRLRFSFYLAPTEHPQAGGQ